MNIGIDVRCLMDKYYSGVPEYTYNLLSNLFTIDKNNNYKLFYNSGQNITDNLPIFNQENVAYIGYKYPNKLFNFSLKFLNYPKIDQLLENLDLFFMPNFNFMALSKKCKKIVTVHDISFELYPQFYTLKRKLWHKFINPQKILNDFDHIISDSTSTKNNLINYYKIKDSKITTIPLGIDHELYKLIPKSENNLTKIKVKYNLPENFILYLGTIEPRKNIQSIIEAFTKIKQQNKHQDLHLVIAGAKGWKFNDIFALANRVKYKNEIKFIDYIAREDKAYVYNLAQILIFPSYYEGFGLPVLEAQACGLPVICGLNSSLPEITNGSALLVNPFDLTSIIRTINLLLTSKNYRQKIVSAGIKNTKNYTWQNTAKKTLELFNF